MENGGMDENNSRRRWLSFGICDLLWAMVVLGACIGWWQPELKHSKSTSG